MRVSVARPLILVLIPLVLMAALVLPARAISYSASAIPTYSQEVSTDTTLQLVVNNTATSTVYTFTWRVTDPTGTTTTFSQSTNSFSSTSIVQDVLFPTDFVGANTNYVGTYAVRVDQTAPSSATNVASTQFQIGLASTTIITRTVPVSLRAQGYQNGENVSVDVRNGGVSVPGFPTYVTATTAQGIVSYTWTPSLSTPLGTDSVRFRGSTTFKFPSDTQSVTIVPTNSTISGLTVTPSSIQRTQAFTITFSASYFNGQPLQSGGAPVRVVEADGTTTHFVAVNYNSTLGLFRGTYRVGTSASTGTWTVHVDRNIVDDGYGNLGPNSPVTAQVGVQSAILTVSISSLSQSYDVGNGIGIFATITNPDGTIVNSGTATATLSDNGTIVSSNIGLTYVPAKGYWTGLYTVAQKDPSGQWKLTVNASDAYGNHGTASASTNVKVPIVTPTGPLLSLPLFLFLVGTAAIGAIAGVAYLTNASNEKKGLPFETLFQLTGGEIPNKSVVLILAQKDQDATALGLQLANRYLSKGYYCGLLAYGLSPEDLAGRARKYGWKPAPYIEKGTLEALDCFTPIAQGGTVKNPLDFAEVGASVGTMLEKAKGIGPAVIVIDSLTSTFKKSAPRKMVTTLSLLAEKVKGENGTLFMAVEKDALPAEELGALRTMADGIIQLGGTGHNRTLEVLKTFNRQVTPLPVEYTVKSGVGIQLRRILAEAKVLSEQGIKVIEVESKKGVRLIEAESKKGAATALKMSKKGLSTMRAESRKHISPFAISLKHSLRTTIRHRMSLALAKRLPASVRLRLLGRLRRLEAFVVDRV